MVQALQDAESAIVQLKAENQRLAELSRKRLQLLRGLASVCDAQCSPSMSDVALVQAIRDAVATQRLLCGGMDSAGIGGSTSRAPGFEPLAPRPMWQPISHTWLAFPLLGWSEVVAAAPRQLAATQAEHGHARWRATAPAKGAGLRVSPISC